MGILDGIVDIIGGGVTGGGLLGLGGSFISGLMSSEGQEDTNAMNYQIAQNNSAFNAEQALINRGFQEMMQGQSQNFAETTRQRAMADYRANRETQYQTAVKDLQSAGLNPMLAYQQGGAGAQMGASPTSGQASGATAQAAMPHPMQNVAAAGIHAASQAAQMRETLSRADVNEAAVERTKAETIRAISSSGHLDAMRDNIRQEMQSFEKRMEKLGHETFWWKYHRELPSYDVSRAEREIQMSYPQMRQLSEHAKKLAAEAKLLGLKVPEAVAEAAWWSDPERGQIGTQFRHGAPSIDKLFTGSMTRGAEMLRDNTRSSSARGFSLNQDRPATGWYGR